MAQTLPTRPILLVSLLFNLHDQFLTTTQRVDSDLDGRATHNTTGHATTGHSTTGHTTTGAYGTSGSTNAGPHDSNLANKADPRVDSDLDRTHGSSGLTGTHGTTGTHGSSGLTGTHGTTGTHGSSGLTGTHGTTGTHNTTGAYGSNTTAGPHSSNIANKADPRVDSDLDGSRNIGGSSNTGAYSGTHAGNTTGTHTGTHGGISHSTNAGPHDSNVANKADPRVDSDLDGRGNRHGAATGGIVGASGSHATAGSGTAQNTAGPHNSDLLNKVDPVSF